MDRAVRAYLTLGYGMSSGHATGSLPTRHSVSVEPLPSSASTKSTLGRAAFTPKPFSLRAPYSPEGSDRPPGSAATAPKTPGAWTTNPTPGSLRKGILKVRFGETPVTGPSPPEHAVGGEGDISDRSSQRYCKALPCEFSEDSATATGAEPDRKSVV